MSHPDDEQRLDCDDRPWSRAIPKPTAMKQPLTAAQKKVRIGIVACLAILVMLIVVRGYLGISEAADIMGSNSSLKQIGLAIHNYSDVHGELPNNTHALDGTPLLSWRVHLLAFIEQDGLYKHFKLDEPWNGPNNLPLLKQIPKIYNRFDARSSPNGTKTYYRGFSHPGAVFEKRPADLRPRPPFGFSDRFSLNSIKDGSSNTIFVVEAGEPVEWTKPDDLDASPGKPFPKMGGMRWRGGSFQALTGDGSTRSFRRDVSETTLRALITYNGGEQVSPDSP